MDDHRRSLLDAFTSAEDYTSDDDPATRDLNSSAAYSIGYEETIKGVIFRFPRWQSDNDLWNRIEVDKWNEAYKLGHEDALGDLILYSVECSKCNRDLNGYMGPLCRYCDGTAE